MLLPGYISHMALRRVIISACLLIVLLLLDLCMCQLPHNIVAVSGHKTGTVMMGSIFRGIAERYNVSTSLLHRWRPHMAKSNRIYRTWKFTDIVKYAPYLGKFKAIIVTRHPLDIFISAQRYHQKSDEPWLHKRRRFLHDKTYQQYMNFISDSAGILVEMTCSPTVYDMISTISETKYNKDIRVYRLDHFRTKYEETCRSLSRHLQLDENILLETAQPFSYEKFVHSDHSSVDATAALQRKDKPYEFDSKLECIHYNHYEAIYGLRSLCAAGYGETTEQFIINQREACKGKPEEVVSYIKRDCECYNSSGFIHAYAGCRYKEPKNFYYDSTKPIAKQN